VSIFLGIGSSQGYSFRRRKQNDANATTTEIDSFNDFIQGILQVDGQQVYSAGHDVYENVDPAANAAAAEWIWGDDCCVVENFWTSYSHLLFSFGTSVNWRLKPRYKTIAARDGEYQSESIQTKKQTTERKGKIIKGIECVSIVYSHTKRKHKPGQIKRVHQNVPERTLVCGQTRYSS
jgi:hypothetical protein